jgi:uncharacterized protein YfaS (alpha-2-macroglobulin family)
MKTKILFLAGFFAMMVFAGTYTYMRPQTEKTEKQNNQKVSVFSTYEKEWKKVDSLISKGLTKSALDQVLLIYAKAKTENNAPNFVKAIIYKIKLKENIEEDAAETSIKEINAEILNASQTVKPVLHSILAEMYWRYYLANRYKFYNRTETINFKDDDIKTWDLTKLLKEVILNYSQSLVGAEKLKTTKLEIYDDIIVKDTASRKFRPTLYDFLAHRAIDFFMNDENSLTSPSYKFELDSQEYLKPSAEFINLKVSSKDSLSLKYYAIKIMQDLVAFHIADANPQALIDVELKRFKFVKDNGVFDNIDSLYLESLIAMESKYASFSASSDISYEIANEYYKKGQKYDPLKSDENKGMLKKAIEKCDLAISKFPKSDGAKNCTYLKNQILYKSVSIELESANRPDLPFRAMVKYANVSNVSVRIIKTTWEQNQKLTKKEYGADLLKEYVKLPVTKEWNLTLPDDGDYQKHSVEIKMPSIPLGYYIVLISNGKGFSLKNQIVAYNDFWMSNIGYFNREKDKGVKQFCVVDRETGKPLVGVDAQAYQNKYNYITRAYEANKWKSFTTDADGFFEMPKADEYRYFYFDFKYGSDRYVTDHEFYQYKYYDYDTKPYEKTLFFSDRAIYRPGQTIYFKGLLMEYDGVKNYKIKPNTKTTVYIYDVNYQKAGELELTSNDYGTFNGTFIAPGALTGQMYITNSSGYLYFSVEEYKRPKFDVKFEPVKGSYKLNEKITVKGSAKAYAGNAIDNASVKYRVVRNANFPYWCWWRGYYPTSPQLQIKNGTTTTDAKGEFSIDFTAIPDLSVKKYDPTFTYTVFADVTDINGETHSSQKYVYVGYKSLLLNLTISGEIEKTTDKSFLFSTTNLSGEKEPAKGTISVFKLQQPEIAYRQRLWTQPDKYLMTKDEYSKDFPNDLYADENNMYKWEKGAKVFEYTFETPNDSVIKFKEIENWANGAYIVETKSKDKYGEDVESFNYFTLYGKNEKMIADNSICWFSMIKYEGEPGENASFLIGTKESNLTVLYEVEYDNKVVSKQWLTLDNEQKLIEVPILEEYRGGFTIHLMAVKHNRYFSNRQTVTVPYTNKMLDIEYETFRDKLLPGEKEQWKIKVKGKNGEKVTAEMLATMYDASLDAYRPNYWNYSLYNSNYSSLYWDAYYSFVSNTSNQTSFEDVVYTYPVYKNYDQLNWFGYYYSNYGNGYGYRGNYSYDGDVLADEEVMTKNAVMATGTSGKDKSAGEKNYKELPKGGVFKNTEGNLEATTVSEQKIDGSGIVDLLSQDQSKMGGDLSAVKARSDFNETAFFYPQLMTDEDGNIVISFTVPEALTKWKIMTLAQTKDLKFGFLQKELVTQKDLMVVPNAPRFFRENDRISFSAKVSNVSTKDLAGEAQLFLFDAVTLKPIDSICANTASTKNFACEKGQSAALSWDLCIPEDVSAIKYKIVAKSGKFTDGEENVVPVLNNRMLVTETLPMPVKGNETKNFTFTKLVNSKSSSTLKNHKLTLEFTSNPAWYAVQALPYMMEYPYECAEQVFTRFYANSIASYIANSSPKIKAVFDAWKTLTPNTLLSNLEKNQDLKSLMLEETPWVLQAQNETERKQRISLLFEFNKMSHELKKALAKLEKMQLPNGGFPWFGGMEDDRYITQHIVTGFGHLDNLGVKDVKDDSKCWQMVKDAVYYLDDRTREDYDWLKKHLTKEEMAKNQTGYLEIQYLYARSYFLNDVEIASKNKEAYNYYLGQIKTYWLENNRYMQGMISLALNRTGNKTTALEIIKSLKENSITNEELGMYWKDMSGGYYWYQAPIETQSLLIEAFDEVANDTASVENLKIWLLKNKQTNDWKTTKATSEATYALLLRGTDWLSNESMVEITMGNQVIDPKTMDDVQVEAGTGYFKTSWTGAEITPEMGKISVKRKDRTGISWGAVYWQYFEQLDKITPAATPLKLEKKLFVTRTSDTGPVIEPITATTKLVVGDKIKVRIELSVDRDMEYVHMKDMRASGFEPVNVISQYKYQDGLGYYESTRDASTNFFFSFLPKGTYVFEYPLYVTHNGDFSNGITNIECMYAPEFSAHSEGIRVKVGE